jgi:hypothetical protein
METCAQCGEALRDCTCKSQHIHVPGEVFPPGATIPPPKDAETPKRTGKRGNFFKALTVALVADATQMVFFPMFFQGALSPANTALDILVGATMVRLMGWHWAFLPTFFSEMLPVFDELPCWTLAVLFVQRERARLETA